LSASPTTWNAGNPGDLDLHVDRAGLDPLKGNFETRWTMPPLKVADAGAAR
jgi:hypothetical protein